MSFGRTKNNKRTTKVNKQAHSGLHPNHPRQPLVPTLSRFVLVSAKATFLHRVPSPQFLGVPSKSGTERPLATPRGERVNSGVDGKSDIIFAAPCASSLPQRRPGFCSPALRQGIGALQTRVSASPGVLRGVGTPAWAAGMHFSGTPGRLHARRARSQDRRPLGAG